MKVKTRGIGFVETAMIAGAFALTLIAGGIGATLNANAGGYRGVEYEVVPEVRVEDGYEVLEGDYRIVQVEDNGNYGAFSEEGLYVAFHKDEGYKLGDLVHVQIISDPNDGYDDTMVVMVSYVVERASK